MVSPVDAPSSRLLPGRGLRRSSRYAARGGGGDSGPVVGRTAYEAAQTASLRLVRKCRIGGPPPTHLAPVACAEQQTGEASARLADVHQP